MNDFLTLMGHWYLFVAFMFSSMGIFVFAFITCIIYFGINIT